jgi:hypothetical protein
LVLGLLLSGNAYAKTTSEYLGDDVWLVKYDEALEDAEDTPGKKYYW